ncbi:hypothetical protein KIN20_032859 [Parelaphostrongylus tenuis]|uniref:Major facilitator superfamily (MFS) profile domain-containing protein n=1 Tax=Parelaphostrongylus tenuis TaxID=148309 RepID=A0AAD5R7R8_PARTN|nr:hypothetical protein KIN20_032859 [Parelaphostrongylus tenuis]
MNDQRKYKDADSSAVSSLNKEKLSSQFKSTRSYFSIGILFIINLLNYMDRYTIAGVLTNVQSYYNIDDAYAGLVQTMFMAFFMVASPICGFLGDRYNRKWIMVVGIAIWVLAVLASTLAPANMFWMFLLFRGVVGIGEASYAVISPSIIADMFTGENRGQAIKPVIHKKTGTRLMDDMISIKPSNHLQFKEDKLYEQGDLYYIAVDSSISESNVKSMSNSELDSVPTPVSSHAVAEKAYCQKKSVLCLVMIIVFIEEPERGAAERKNGILDTEITRTTYFEDLRRLLSNPTYVFSTLGYTAIVFVVGTLTWWGPTAIEHNYAYNRGLNSTDQLDANTKARVNSIFGALTCIGGISGVAIGSITSQWLREGLGPFRYVKTIRSDAIICCVGALIAVPTLYFALHEIPHNMDLAWVLMFICITATCFNWATNVNMLMDVVAPIRRNTANSWQILISHLFGDASGPYILGMISDAIRGKDDSPRGHFKSLLTSFYLPDALLVVSAIIFAIAAYTFVRDHRIFQNEIGSLTAASSTSHLKDSSSLSLGSAGGLAKDNMAFSVPLPSQSPYSIKTSDLPQESTKM